MGGGRSGRVCTDVDFGLSNDEGGSGARVGQEVQGGRSGCPRFQQVRYVHTVQGLENGVPSRAPSTRSSYECLDTPAWRGTPVLPSYKLTLKRPPSQIIVSQPWMRIIACTSSIQYPQPSIQFIANDQAHLISSFRGRHLLLRTATLQVLRAQTLDLRVISPRTDQTASPSLQERNHVPFLRQVHPFPSVSQAFRVTSCSSHDGSPVHQTKSRLKQTLPAKLSVRVRPPWPLAYQEINSAG